MINYFNSIPFFFNDHLPVGGGIGRVSDSGRIEVSPKFMELEELEKEFLITHLLCLYKNKEKGTRKLCKADEEAMAEMQKRHPETPKSYWLKVFLKFIDGVPSDLNIRRANNLKNKLE